MTNVPFLATAVAVVVMTWATPTRAEIIGGVEFPQGAISFADEVTSYAPAIVSGEPAAVNRVSTNAVGLPTDSNFVSLGDGGVITLRFIDNRLTGSGSSALDLWIFEVGPDVEDTFVEISKDNITYVSVGKVFGSTAGIDIDAFGFGVSDQFAYVRLQDDTNEGQQSGASVGADINAIGAISTVAANPVPEPQTFLMLLGGGIALALRKTLARRA
jgi:PEP-CTERM motif